MSFRVWNLNLRARAIGHGLKKAIDTLKCFAIFSMVMIRILDRGKAIY